MMICKYCGKEIPIKSTCEEFIRTCFDINICNECVEEAENQLRDLKRRRIDICEALRSSKESSS